MAISVNWTTRVISVPVTDLTLVSAGVYDCDTVALWNEIKAAEADSVAGIVHPDLHSHNSDYTVVGTTYAPKIELIDSCSIEFLGGPYSVRFQGSNNNFFDVANGVFIVNGVTPISGNSAGLQTVNIAGTVPALTAQNIADLTEAMWAAAEDANNVPGSMGEKMHLAALAYFAALSLH